MLKAKPDPFRLSAYRALIGRSDGAHAAVCFALPKMANAESTTAGDITEAAKATGEVTPTIDSASTNSITNAGETVNGKDLPKNNGGEALDINFVKNAYGKDKGFAGFMERNEYLYLDPDKKRTNTWMRRVGLQLPSDATKYGSFGTISYADGDVNIQGVPWEKQVDGYFNGDGTQKRSDSLYVGESNVKGVEKAPLYIPTSVITKATREQQGRRSAHGIENFIKNSIFLYLDPQKNRTDTWFHSLRLQLPSGKTMYGSIGRISYADGDVNIQGVPWEKLVDGYFNGDGTQKRSDSLYVGEANVNPMIDNLGSDATIHIRNEKKLNQMLPGNQILKSLELLAKVKLDSDSIANNSDSVKQNLSERVTHHCNTYRRIKFSTDIGLNECTNCDKLKSTKANARRTAAAYQTLQNRKRRKDHENCCPVRKRRSVPAFWTCCRI